MDGNTSPNYECSKYTDGHHPTYDFGQSGPERSVFVCVCGHTVVENEDSGTGA